MNHPLKRNLLCATLALTMATHFALPVLAQEAALPALELDKQIAAKEVELLKLNADFRQHYTKGEKGKQRRMKFYDFAAGGVANAGDITIMSMFWKYQRKPGEGLNHRGRLESGFITVLVAYCLLGGMYSAEGVADLIGDYRGKRQGWDAKSMRNKIVALKDELDKLLSARDTQIAQASIDESTRATLVAEGNVLKDIRDLGILEFSKLYIDSRKKHSARDITTIGTLAVCATGAFPGALGVIRGLQRTNLKKVGGGGIGFLISGSTLTAAPLLIHGGAAITAKVAAQRLSKELGEVQCKTAEKLAQDTGALQSQLASATGTTPAALASSLETYQVMGKILTDRQNYLEKDRKDQKKEMIESFITYAMKGGPQIALGCDVIRAGYRWNRNPYKAFKGVAQGATANEVSWGLWMLDVVQKSARNEIKWAKAQPSPFAETEDLKKLETLAQPRISVNN